jgi:hypothetical protein
MHRIKAFLTIFLLVMLMACGGGGETGGNNGSSPIFTISGTPPTSINEDELYEFQVSTGNGVGKLSYAITNAPNWMTISQTGVVSGMALTDADTGTFSGIVVSATDSNQNKASLPSFTLQVNAVNDPPLVSFESKTLALEARQTFSFAYSVTDEENDPFEVSIQGMQDELALTPLERSIEGTVIDVGEVTKGKILVSVNSNGQSITTELDVTLYPMTSSGLGKTIIGSKQGPGIHLVILGDGYQEQEFELYQQDAYNFIADMSSDPGIAQHMPVWNIHVVKTHSIESGVDDEYGVDEINTYFNSGYGCNDIDRLVCADNGVIYNVLLNEYPHFDQSVLIVNGTKYGGSGGFVSIFSRTSPEIALHEMGHSFANLADEYIDENLAESAANRYQEGSLANVSTSIDPNLVPWAHWIDDKDNYPMTEGEEGVGIFEGSYYNDSGFYRPLSSSRMKANAIDFGVVNSEQWIISIYQTAGAVSSLSPSSGALTVATNQDAKFSVEPIFDSQTQSIEWYIDNVLQSQYNHQKTINISKPVGEYAVAVKVNDITAKVRKVGSSADFTFVWQLTVN